MGPLGKFYGVIALESFAPGPAEPLSVPEYHAVTRMTTICATLLYFFEQGFYFSL